MGNGTAPVQPIIKKASDILGEKIDLFGSQLETIKLQQELITKILLQVLKTLDGSVISPLPVGEHIYRSHEINQPQYTIEK